MLFSLPHANLSDAITPPLHAHRVIASAYQHFQCHALSQAVPVKWLLDKSSTVKAGNPNVAQLLVSTPPEDSMLLGTLLQFVGSVPDKLHSNFAMKSITFVCLSCASSARCT